MSSITPIAKQFALHNRLFNNVLEGIEDTHGGDRLSDQVNHLQWIAGHVTVARYNFTSRLGMPQSFPYVELYTDATKPPPNNREIDATVTYPAISEILRYWNELAPAFTAAVGGFNDEQLAMVLPFGNPIGGNTLFDLLSFLASHESYHIGQMSIIRKYLGLSAMSYK